MRSTAVSVMHRVLITLIVSTLIGGCSSTATFSATSRSSIDQLHAPCVGPLSVFYINHEGEPIIQISIHRNEGLTELYFSKHESIQNKELIWPEKIDVLLVGETISVEDTAKLGVNVLKDTMAYYVVPSLPDEFTVMLGSVRLAGENIAVDHIDFSHGFRKFLMCVQ